MTLPEHTLPHMFSISMCASVPTFGRYIYKVWSDLFVQGMPLSSLGMVTQQYPLGTHLQLHCHAVVRSRLAVLLLHEQCVSVGRESSAVTSFACGEGGGWGGWGGLAHSIVKRRPFPSLSSRKIHSAIHSSMLTVFHRYKTNERTSPME